MPKVKEVEVDIEEILDRLEPRQKEIVQNLRELIKSTVQKLLKLLNTGKSPIN